MRIALVGSRGIPNNYGGFEQFAEHISVELVRRGHRVAVYNPHFHPYQGSEYEGVRIIRRFSPEQSWGAAGNFLFDFLSLRHAVRDENDVVLELGYGTSAPSLLAIRRGRTRIVTNMDGLEWKRGKWSRPVQLFMRRMEQIAVRHSDALVADNPGIATYLENEFGLSAATIPYGTDLSHEPRRKTLSTFGVESQRFSLIIARLVPENNVHRILEGYVESGDADPLLVIGSVDNRYGRRLARRFGDTNVRFLGTIFDREVLDGLRRYSKVYFHGHSVGGTNPSLLEAMAAGALVAADDNPFNRAVLKEGGVYFSSATDVSTILASAEDLQARRPEMVERNRARIRTTYSWDRVTDQYEALFRHVVSNYTSVGSDVRPDPHAP